MNIQVAAQHYEALFMPEHRTASTLIQELQFQRQQVQDVAKVAEYYRALVQEARDERDAAMLEV